MEWDGENGEVRYYDKATKENIGIGDNLTFILLDRLSVVKGWHERSKSGITSNEVKDMRAEPLTVRAYKGGVIAEGLYSAIKDRVNAAGGHYTANLYVAFKADSKGPLEIGSIQLKGAALSAWMDFEKDNRGELYKQAIQFKGHEQKKKGKIDFCVPKFALKEISEDTNKQAVEIDKRLQDFLASYFQKTRSEQTSKPSDHEPEYDQEADSVSERGRTYEEPDDSLDTPF